MNRKEKGWLAEAAVKRFQQGFGHEVRNLAPAEPASDLIVIHEGEVIEEIEVKYGRRPGELDREEKEGIWAGAQRCKALGRSYTLWCVIPTLGPRGRPVALTAHIYGIEGLGPSSKRKGVSLSTFKGSIVPLPLPAMGQGGEERALPTLPLSNKPDEEE